MRKVINNKVYDTTTAVVVGTYSSSAPTSDLDYRRETLYKKRTGEYFIYGEGGPRSPYAKVMDDGSWGWGEAIHPVSLALAQKFAETKLTAAEYEGAFGALDDDTLTVSLPPRLIEAIRAMAEELGLSVSDYIKRVCENLFE